MSERCGFPRVELRGSQLDLENLAAVFRDGNHRVRLDNELYWLHSTDFDDIASDPDKARMKAINVLALINGIAKACIPVFHPVELGQCVDWIRQDGQPKRRLTATIDIHTRSGKPVTQDASTENEIEGLRSIAQSHSEVGDVLRLWGSTVAHDWITLYKIKEQIEAAVDDQIFKWATKTELRRFNQTANSPAVLGHAARHGVQYKSPPPYPMTIVEARDLVARLIRGWIREHQING
jgi:hypothetical protein